MQSFRLGTTSFVYRAGWSDNVARLAGRVQDVELLCFDAARPGDLPSAAEIRRLRDLRDEHALSYSLHTPLEASLASGDEPRRLASVQQVLDVVTHMQALDAHAIVLHVYLGECEHDPRRPIDLEAWRGRAARSIEALLGAGITADRLCVESLDYDLALIEPVIERYGLSIALDIGHIHRDGLQLPAMLQRYLPRTKLVQWHGTDPKDRDHRSLAHYPEASARWLLRTLRDEDFRGVLTLEVFRETDFEASMQRLHEWLREVAA